MTDSTPANATPIPSPPGDSLYLLEDAVHSIRRAARIAVHCEQSIPTDDDRYIELVGQAIRDVERAADELVLAFTAAWKEMAAASQGARS